MSPFNVTMVVVASPTRMLLCNPQLLVTNFRRIHAEFTKSKYEVCLYICESSLLVYMSSISLCNVSTFVVSKLY